MTATTFTDDLIREYLLFRGFIATFKAFETELKSDKDKGFRVDKIVDQLCSYITSYDLASLREAWAHLDQRIFARLEHAFMPTVRKLENSLLKMYVVNTVQTNRHDKMTEFFERMSQELQNQPEWKEWFVLPFIKNVEENPVFQVYFTRQWQDTMLVSLHNFLSVIFQSMALPTLMSYEEEQNKMAQLQEENDCLKNQLVVLQMKERRESTKFLADSADSDIPAASELMDDFYVIAQEPPAVDAQSKSIRALFKNIGSGLPTSPILGRRPSIGHFANKKINVAEEPAANRSSLPRTKKGVSSANYTSQGSSSLPRCRGPSESDGATKRTLRASQSKEELISSRNTSVNVGSKRDSCNIELLLQSEKTVLEAKEKSSGSALGSNLSLLPLSQEEYTEHRSAITHCKFNASGTLIASSDSDGVIKIWVPSPTPRTAGTVMSKSSILALEWARKRERLLLFGNKMGIIRLYDTKEKKSLCEVGIDSNTTPKEHKIMCLACSPTGTLFASGSASRNSSAAGDKGLNNSLTGRLLLWDMKIMKLDRCLNIDAMNPVINCCIFNHNGQLLVVGTADGRIHLFDMLHYESITQWQAHQGETYSIQFSADETSCYSMGSDGKFIQWSIYQTGKKISEFKLHDRCAGPFTTSSGQASPWGSYYQPVGKLFVFDAEGKHVLTCSDNSGIIYRVAPSQTPAVVMSLGGHKSPVVTVDWATTVDCGTCVTASLDGKIRVSTLLAQ